MEKSNIISYPEFIEEQEVTIDGYNSDCMEPFISKDGKYLFFNNLNDSIDTTLFYSTAISETNFKFQGKVENANGVAPHLDAVASMDRSNNFYWVSTRNYPSVFENIQTGQFIDGKLKNVSVVKGDFYLYSPGWIVMDAEITEDGNLLYYVNSKFSGKPFPDEAKLGIAQKKGDIFTKLSSSEVILKNINDSNYLVFAPSISFDGKELYFTRVKKGDTNTEICVSVRTNSDENFTMPKKIDVSGNSVEAATLTKDGTRLYYHKKLNDGKYHIFTNSTVKSSTKKDSQYTKNVVSF